MTYDELTAYLGAHWRKTTLTEPVRSYDFAAFDRLLEAVGRPERGLRYLHITGSKGKGSTAYLASRLLQAHGVRTGLFTSPHLIRVEERISVDGRVIPPECFAAEISATIAARDDVAPDLGIFPALIAAALRWFVARGVEAAVVEVRSGGRYDPTNIIPARHQVLTAIEAEHIPGLGRTVAEIAAQKAGIIKPGSLVTVQKQREDVRRVIEAAAAEARATVRWAGNDFTACPLEQSPRGSRFRYRTPAGTEAEAGLGLLGPHQVANAATALAAVEGLLAGLGRVLDPAAVSRALAGAAWPARLELLSGDPPVLYDAAHTPQSAQALAESLRAHFGDRRWEFIVGLLRSKDAAGFFAGLAPVAARVLTVPIPGFAGHDPAELARIARDAGIAAEARPSFPKALAELRSRQTPIAVAGTMYLYAACRALVEGRDAVLDGW